MSHSQQMVEALDRQELEEAEVQFQQALLEDSEAQLLDLGQYLESIGFYPQAKEIYEQIAETYPEVYLSLATILAEEGQMEEAFAYLEEIGPESNWYVASLLVKADLYQMEGLADVAREKLVEAAHLSDDPIIQLGLAEIDLELERYQEAIQEYAQLDNREILEATGISTYQRIGFAYANLGKFEAAVPFLEKALEIEFDDQIAYELATLLSDQEEFQKALQLIIDVYEDFNLTEYRFRLSLRDPKDTHKYYDDDEMWENAQSMLKAALDEMGVEYFEAEGEAAFYGPKLDIQVKTALGNEETLSTIQLDFLLPERFGLTYIGADGEEHRPVMIHRGVISTMERFTAILIENYKGAFPTWLAPHQVTVIPVSNEAHVDYAWEVAKVLRDKGVPARPPARRTP